MTNEPRARNTAVPSDDMLEDMPQAKMIDLVKRLIRERDTAVEAAAKNAADNRNNLQRVMELEKKQNPMAELRFPGVVHHGVGEHADHLRDADFRDGVARDVLMAFIEGDDNAAMLWSDLAKSAYGAANAMAIERARTVKARGLPEHLAEMLKNPERVRIHKTGPDGDDVALNDEGQKSVEPAMVREALMAIFAIPGFVPSVHTIAGWSLSERFDVMVWFINAWRDGQQMAEDLMPECLKNFIGYTEPKIHGHHADMVVIDDILEQSIETRAQQFLDAVMEKKLVTFELMRRLAWDVLGFKAFLHPETVEAAKEVIASDDRLDAHGTGGSATCQRTVTLASCVVRDAEEKVRTEQVDVQCQVRIVPEKGVFIDPEIAACAIAMTFPGYAPVIADALSSRYFRLGIQRETFGIIQTCVMHNEDPTVQVVRERAEEMNKMLRDPEGKLHLLEHLIQPQVDELTKHLVEYVGQGEADEWTPPLAYVHATINGVRGYSAHFCRECGQWPRIGEEHGNGKCDKGDEPVTDR